MKQIYQNMKNYLQTSKKARMLSCIYIILFPVILFFAMELLNPGVISPVVNILGFEFGNPFIKSPYSDVLQSVPLFLVYMLTISLLLFVVSTLTGSVFTSSVMVSVLLAILYIANYYRKLLSGWVLSPPDLLLATKLGGIVSITSIKIDKHVVVSMGILLVALIIMYFAEIANKVMRNQYKEKCIKALKERLDARLDAQEQQGLEKNPFLAKFRIQMLRLILDLYRNNPRRRMVLFCVGFVCVITVFFTTPFQSALYQFISVDYSTFKVSSNHLYKRYGVLFGFYLSAQQGKLNEILAAGQKNRQTIQEEINELDPLYNIGDADFYANYSRSFMEGIAEGVKEALSSGQASVSPGEEALPEKPNVIVIMSEAFADPTNWSNIEFTKDPIPVYRELTKTQTHGKILTPAFGGATCNPEFEFLTGNSMYFTDLGEFPFLMVDKYMPNTDTRALPQVFKRNGYKTVGVHTYEKSFYQRDIIYPRMGFDVFIGKEDLENIPENYKGKFMSDEYFTTQIINQIEATDEPLFLYGISMQNHYEYYPNKYHDEESQTLLSRSKYLTEFDRLCADAYIQGIYDADKQLGRLIEYLKTSDKPTIVYFFGDHLPIIGTGNSFYQKLGMINSEDLSEWTLDVRYQMFTTPYILWANYELPQHDWGNMSTMFIGSLLLDLAGLDKNMYFSFLNDVYRESFHAIRIGIYENEDGTLFENPIVQDKEALERLTYLQYDRIIGEGYADQMQSEIISKGTE